MLPLITHVIPTLAPYGAERMALELAARSPAHGFRTRVLVLFQGGALQEECRRRDIRWSHVFPVAAGPRVVSRPALVHRLHQKLYAEPERMPAIVHTHLFGSDFWTSIARAAHWSSVRPKAYVSTAHNIDHDDSTMRRLARRWATRRMDRVVAISNDVARYTHEDLGVPEKRILTIPNGINFKNVPTRGERAFAETPRLLMVGRLVPQKGHATVLQALKHVALPWKLSIVGEGPLRRELKELSEKCGLASRVRFLGERKDVPQLLKESDLFLFPSQWEGMGLALIEALAAGVPSLASDLPAIREFVPKKQLLDSDDIHAWRAAITDALTTPGDRVASASKLAQKVRTRYDVERMVAAYAEMYRALLNA